MIARLPTARRSTRNFSARNPFSGSRGAARLALAGLAAAFCLAAPAASAQGAYFASRAFYDEPDTLIPPRVVVYRLQNRGFTEIARPRFDGAAYVIDATGPNGLRTRLFVDAHDGGIVGRQRLDAPYYPSARPNRPAPGYGWTEEDGRFGRSARGAAGLVPPADIPDAPPTGLPRASRAEASLAAPAPIRPGGDASPFGVNPEGKARPLPAPRKAAKLGPPQKPAAPNAVPPAPAPKVETTEAPKPEAAPSPETATAEPPRTDTVKPEPSTPAAVRPPATEKAPETADKDVAKEPAAKEAAAKPDQAWKDPPADEGKRKVRVIDGATIVPGSGENAAPTAN